TAHNLGEAKRKLGELDSASLYLSDSLALELATANPTGAAYTRGTRAAILFLVGSFEEAAQEFRALAKEFHHLEHKAGEARSLQNLAGALTASCEASSVDQQATFWREIFSAFEGALTLHRQLKDAQSECVVLNNLGLAQIISGRLDDASGSF